MNAVRRVQQRSTHDIHHRSRAVDSNHVIGRHRRLEDGLRQKLSDRLLEVCAAVVRRSVPELSLYPFAYMLSSVCSKLNFSM